MSHPYPASAVANFFIKEGVEGNDEQMTMLKVMKLTYIAHGWSLGLLKKPLIEEEVEAWKYGPVIPSIYHALKHLKNERLRTDDLIEELDLNSFQTCSRLIEDQDKDSLAIASKVFEIYKSDSGNTLVDRTHQKGTPWDLIYAPGSRGLVIPNDLIKRYYKNFFE